MSKLMKLKSLFNYRTSNDIENQMTLILDNHEGLNDVNNAREEKYTGIARVLAENRLAIIFAFVAILSFGISLLAIFEGKIFILNWISILPENLYLHSLSLVCQITLIIL